VLSYAQMLGRFTRAPFSSSRRVVVSIVVVAAVAGGGAALAATQLDSPSARSKAIIDDAAGRLGIQSSALADALEKATEDQIDAAVAAGELTQAQGDALKQRIESSDFPLLGFGGGRFGGPGALGVLGLGRHLGLGGVIEAATSYLGVTASELRTDLASGKSLAEIAKVQGKTVDGLETALLDAAEKQLDAAVGSGKLTQAQADSIQSELKSHIDDLVNGTLPTPGLRDGHRRFGGGHGFFGFGPGAPPPGADGRPPSPTA